MESSPSESPAAAVVVEVGEREEENHDKAHCASPSAPPSYTILTTESDPSTVAVPMQHSDDTLYSAALALALTHAHDAAAQASAAASASAPESQSQSQSSAQASWTAAFQEGFSRGFQAAFQQLQQLQQLNYIQKKEEDFVPEFAIEQDNHEDKTFYKGERVLLRPEVDIKKATKTHMNLIISVLIWILWIFMIPLYFIMKKRVKKFFSTIEVVITEDHLFQITRGSTLFSSYNYPEGELVDTLSHFHTLLQTFAHFRTFILFHKRIINHSITLIVTGDPSC
eukprot:TRINITY_DN2974_c0_g1_i2.p1 TRINITY_DN2974_c0_g1~~TRINITY_DN2974_c0_g1_i2.p1  ORF type:complete len:282 (+),score=54.54 TRINITY_DN2974_c0_g1_i2:1-846(+)